MAEPGGSAPSTREEIPVLGTTVDTVDDLVAFVGQHLGTSDWLEVSQNRVNTFADATDDQQWIHVDPERAASGPFSGPIAPRVPDPGAASSALGAGADRESPFAGDQLRTEPGPVPRAGAGRLPGPAVRDVGFVRTGPRRVQIVVDAVVEREGGDPPVCVAQPIYRIYA